ncbi:hypothetical protein SO802_006727 [Lithocarpus litseifolius]|uniref:C2 domain-containing protein n=1 Tax=Lithocarpus litseifolius TaxID=425828 RepID=A0AAW2DQ71_9ROSI
MHQRLREIEVLIISAQDLKMRAYAVVYVQKGVHVAKTHVDEHGGTNPAWNEVVKVRFKEDSPESDVMAALNVDIYAHRHVREKPVGSARVLLRRFERPTRKLEWWDGGEILGGRDELAGGAWLACSRDVLKLKLGEF